MQRYQQKINWENKNIRKCATTVAAATTLQFQIFSKFVINMDSFHTHAINYFQSENNKSMQ